MLLDTAACVYSSAQNRERVNAGAAFTATLMKRIFYIDSGVMSRLMLIHTVRSNIDTHTCTNTHSQTDPAHLQHLLLFLWASVRFPIMNSARMLVSPR